MNYGKKYNRNKRVGMKNGDGEIEAVAINKLVGYFKDNKKGFFNINKPVKLTIEFEQLLNIDGLFYTTKNKDSNRTKSTKFDDDMSSFASTDSEP